MRKRIFLSDKRCIELRPLSAQDSLEELTDLLHAAYRPLAARGMRYLASHQDSSITLERANKGHCFVGLLERKIVATVTLVPQDRPSRNAWYQRPDVAHFQQFAVTPALQGQGVGKQIMEFIEELAAAGGAAELALDTSENAHALIEFYTRRGYRLVATEQWEVTNYRSLVLSKKLSEK